MAGLNIPGVTDQYNTNDTVEKLMQVERIPLTREQKQLETYKAEKDAWRDVNSKLTTLRDKTKNLYSYENPFNSKITSSSQENSITAEATRSADIQSFKVDVIQAAASDRFLSDDLAADYKIPAGNYVYKVGEKTVSFNWKGGSVKDFANSLNKRGNGIIKSSVIGASAGKKALLIEAVPTGKENKLIFEDAAKTLAFDSGMIAKIKSNAITLQNSQEDLKPLQTTAVQKITAEDNIYMPSLSFSNAEFLEETVKVEPRGAYQIEIPAKVTNTDGLHVTFTIKAIEETDITEEINRSLLQPELPDSGSAEFAGITIENSQSDTTLDLPPTPPEPLDIIQSETVILAIMEDGSEKEITVKNLLDKTTHDVDINLAEYDGIKAIAIANTNTGYSLEISNLTAMNPSEDLGYGPAHPISQADDAIIKYEGITITRPSNKIDDVIPEITLNVHDRTEKTATISVAPDKEASKNAIIEFVGYYNQAVAEINILSQNKNELIEELDYLTDSEKEAEYKKLGMFSTDFSLTNIKSNMQTIIVSGYNFSDYAQINQLSQIGIGTNASGFSGGYSQSKLRGYLEIDEKKLDNAIENHLDDIRQLFGFDSDGDLIVDSGIAYKLDKQISAYTQTGGILSLKTSTLDSKIKSSETRITKLESQMDEKEAQLRQKYSQMEGSLNSLESQQTTINNFTRQNQRNNN